MLKIGISGSCGKMGKRIAELASKDPDITISAALERQDSPDMGKDLGSVIGTGELRVVVSSNLGELCENIDCLIDFTLPEPTLGNLAICREKKVSMVIGTTGIDSEGEKAIEEAAGVIPIVFSPNMAVGVNLLFNIVREAARVLKNDFDTKIDETHHVHKKDSPSGTAKMIARMAAESTGVEPPIEAFREGEVIGNHGIVFDGKYERLEIRHEAKSRDVFAAGALEGAKFTVGKSPGLYNMSDVLGLA